MATDMPRLTKPCVSGGDTCMKATSALIRPFAIKYGIWVSEIGRFRADEETAVVISRLLLDPKWPQTSRKEIKQLDVRRGWLAALKGLDQSKWRCTSRSDKYAVAGLDDLDGRL